MSDLFHKGVPFSFVDKVFDTIEQADWHTFQILTKRSSRQRDYVNDRYAKRSSPPNLWLGTSVEDASKVSRIRHIRDTRATVRFLSIEPLIGPMGTIDLTGIHWVIVGGESGPSARPIDADWVRSIRDQCLEAKVKFFFKQWGGYRPKTGGRDLDGRKWNQMPAPRGRTKPQGAVKPTTGLTIHGGDL